MFTEPFTVLFWTVAVALTCYGSSMMVALAAGALVWLNADWWTVNNNDPDSRASRLGVLRDVKPLDLTAAWKGGRPKWPVFQESGQRFTLQGYHENGKLRPGVLSDWNIFMLDENEDYPHPIQSAWGWFSPIYLFRMIAYSASGRHVIRIWFPFILFGFWEIVRPAKATYIRAIPRGRPLGTHQILEEPEGEQLDSAKVRMIRDTTDHARLIFKHDVLTNAFPLSSGHSVRVHARLVFQTLNLQQILSFEEWSDIVNGAVGNVTRMFLGGKSLREGYALKEAISGLNTDYQKAVFTWLTDSSQNFLLKRGRADNEVKLSITESLGLLLTTVQYVDIEAADKDTEKDMRRILSIIEEGDAKAHAAGKMAEKLGAEPEGAAHIAAIEGARHAGHVDFIIGGNSDTAATGFRARTARNTARGEGS